MDLDTGRRDDEEGSPRNEAYDLYKAGAAVAGQGGRKLQYWLAKLPPERRDLLTENQVNALRQLSKNADVKVSEPGL